MTTLLALEPQSVRRILKAGLRQGIADSDLKQLIKESFDPADEGHSEALILQTLQMRGWLVCQEGRWKTKLG
jgi:hypothetical protein